MARSGKEHELAVIEDTRDAMEVLPAQELSQRIKALHQFQEVVRKELQEGVDYGIIPGTGSKPTLLKPGAEKLAKMHGLADRYEILSEVEDWDRPFFRYKFKCRLEHVRTGVVVSEGVGECNSMESKYRFRWIKQGDQRVRVENDQVFDQVNTILKMGKKRALVDAVLSACRLSAVFTQDVEDMKEVIEGEQNGKNDPIITEKQYNWLKGEVKKRTIKDSVFLGIVQAAAPNLPTTEKQLEDGGTFQAPNLTALTRSQWEAIMRGIGVKLAPART